MDDILADLESLDDQQQQLIEEQEDNGMILQVNQQYEKDEEQLGNDRAIGQGPYKHQQSKFNSKAASLLKDSKFLAHMQSINTLIDKKIEQGKNYTPSNVNQQKQYIHQSNEYGEKIDREILGLFRRIKVIYNQKFPEIESIVTKPPLYCKTVAAIERHLEKWKSINEGTNLQAVNQQQSNNIPRLQDISLPFLTSHQIIAIKISISSLHDDLHKQQKQEFYQLCDSVSLLYEHHNALMIFLQSTMQIVAPNLCQFVGSVIASKLISTAGGVDKLANMPACNVQVIGGQRNAQVGFALMERNHTGIFGQMDLVKQAPKKFQMQLVRMLASNTVKCAKADMLGSRSNLGAKFKQQMFERFQKVQQQGGLMRTQKPMDIPDQQPKKKRGGKRHRKTKQLYQMSEVRKQQNRLQFGLQGQIEYGQEGQGLGMLKTSGLGKLKVNIKKQKLNVSKKMTQRMQKKSGMQSSLDFGSKQGIQLVNPQTMKQRQQQQQQARSGGTQSYFARQSGFRTVLNNKFGLTGKKE